jgi:hypothetical protein
MKRPIVFFIAGFFLLVVIVEVYGSSVTDKLHIQTTVPPELEYEVQHEPSTIKITPSDLRKGYNDLNLGTVLSVTTNDPNGYIISISSQGGEFFSSIVVTIDDGDSYELLPDGSVDIHVPYVGPKPERKKLSYRFYLLTTAARIFKKEGGKR